MLFLRSQGRSPQTETLETPPVRNEVAVKPAQTDEAIQHWLSLNLAVLAEVDLSAIDTRLPLADYGLDSIQVARLSGDLEAWLGRDLSPSLIYDYPTIEALARHLAEEK
jgi:acyl carrier protein